MHWNQLRGHFDQIEMFRRTIARGRLSHSYLFAGPDGIGKREFAKLLAQCLLCQRVDEAELMACGECSGCRQVLAGTHPDFFVVGRREGKSELTIDVFLGPKERRGQEGLCYELSRRSMSGGRRVAIIDDADSMNVESANALLKTLEEPPEDSLLILLAANLDAILPTIRSRCQFVRFHPLPTADVADLLLQQELVTDQAEAARLADLSEGSLTTARQLLEPGLNELRQVVYAQLSAPRYNSLSTSAKISEVIDKLGGSTAQQRQNALLMVRFCVEFFRAAMLQLSANIRPSTAEVARFADRLHPDSADVLESLVEVVERVVRAESQLESNLVVSLCLEGLFDELGPLMRRMGF